MHTLTNTRVASDVNGHTNQAWYEVNTIRLDWKVSITMADDVVCFDYGMRYRTAYTWGIWLLLLYQAKLKKNNNNAPIL